MDEHTFHQAGVGSASRHPDVDSAFPAPTSAYFVGKFVHHAGRVYHWTAPAGVGQAIAMPSTKVKAVQQRWHADDAVRTALEGVESSAATVGQGTSSGVGESSDTGNIHLHPFVRLPAASLTTEDVEKLMAEAELLASYAAQKLAVPCSICKAGNVFMKLSSLFMMFDYLVCTIEILGEKMNTGRWWREFAEKFQTEYSLTVNTTKERTVALTKLVNRLSSALSIYKEGRRPPLSDIIQLKREIITQAYRNSQLSNSLWKLWLQDDEDFSSSSGDIERPPGSEKQGQR
ncbi:uncharacterized protein EMH_0052940 [Eimeria mitis]|uniref:Uncharacterized protein n=1 Tax=Eimeria mitis TaxID=44415 RepID=U6JWF8_9EIME|nr:uncharacterized protein EMH_0052940 [Eimeria mitis]CDJ29820.1 hypothetical protein EMH_0052940 [Eimeria mitis]